MFAQTHSRGPAITPPSALPGVQNDDNDVDDVADIADEDIIDADNDYAAKPPGSSCPPSLPRLSPGCPFNWKLKY